LRIHKCTKNFLHFDKIELQLNKKIIEIQISTNPIHTFTKYNSHSIGCLGTLYIMHKVSLFDEF
jgi:hypothetical protein